MRMSDLIEEFIKDLFDDSEYMVNDMKSYDFRNYLRNT